MEDFADQARCLGQHWMKKLAILVGVSEPNDLFVGRSFASLKGKESLELLIGHSIISSNLASTELCESVAPQEVANGSPNQSFVMLCKSVCPKKTI